MSVIGEEFERQVTEALIPLIEGERDRTVEFAPLSVGPYTAFLLIGLLQLLWRHPSLSARHKTVIEDLTGQLSVLFGGVLAEAIKLGWDTSYDVEQDDEAG